MQAEQIANKMVELFGDKIVDPDIFPKIFQYQVKIAKWELQNESKVQSS